MIATRLPTFTLHDAAGQPHAFPSGRPTLLCFVKEDCPTCALCAPLLEATQRAYGQAMDLWAVTQDADSGAWSRAHPALTLPVLDDAALRVSHRFDLDTVPTVVLADGGGCELRRVAGFGRRDWQDLFQALTELTGCRSPAVDWATYPESRPGCGSRSLEPGIAERLAAEAEGSPLRARRITLGEDDDALEFLFDQGLTDGLPVALPTPERVLRMFAGTRRNP
jgi:hypothetical protein